MTTYRAAAPSNIALIKYMGKTDAGANQATNSSLSLTLGHLLTTVELVPISEGAHRWEPLPVDGTELFEISEKGLIRFFKHLDFLRDRFGVATHFLIRSGNNFPADCGLASSASSFAALTMAFREYVQTHWAELSRSKKDWAEKVENINQDSLWAGLSQKGSGSSCRSFFSPWSLWSESGATSVGLPWSQLGHDVMIVENSKKAVSSSEAHLRVVSSLLFEGRVKRANQRLEEILKLREATVSSWRRLFEICWEEFWDMHALFETSRPHFGYMTEGSHRVLAAARELWSAHDDGPVVTMDAGPNIHFLWRADQAPLREKLILGIGTVPVISSPDFQAQPHFSAVRGTVGDSSEVLRSSR